MISAAENLDLKTKEERVKCSRRRQQPQHQQQHEQEQELQQHLQQRHEQQQQQEHKKQQQQQQQQGRSLAKMESSRSCQKQSFRTKNLIEAKIQI